MNIHDILPLCSTELDNKIVKDNLSQIDSLDGNKGKSFDWQIMNFATKDSFEIEMIDKKSIFDDKQHGWLWYKNLNIPTLKFKHTSLMRQSRDLNVQLFGVRKGDKSWTEVPLKGTLTSSFNSQTSVSQLNSLRFSDTSYNYKGQKFILIVAFYEALNTKPNHSEEMQEEAVLDENIKKIISLHGSRLLSLKISPPIYVESRKKSYQERPEMITKHYSKGKGQAMIQNSMDDLHTYFTTATIRHKDDKFFYETQKEIFNNLFDTSSDTSDDPPLLMCLKKQKNKDWPKDIQKIDKFLSNIESTALGYLESSEFPFQISEEYAEIVYSEQLKTIYTRSYNQISNIQFQMQSQKASNQSALLYQQQIQGMLNNTTQNSQSVMCESNTANFNNIGCMSENKISPQNCKLENILPSSFQTPNNSSLLSHQNLQYKIISPMRTMMNKVDDQYDSLNRKRTLQDTQIYSTPNLNNQNITPYSTLTQNILKSESWESKLLNPQLANTNLNSISPHNETLSSLIQSNTNIFQNEPELQKRRESQYSQREISSQHQYSCIDTQTTKQLSSPNTLSQFTIPSQFLIQEASLSPKDQQGQSPQIPQQSTLHTQMQNQMSVPSIPQFQPSNGFGQQLVMPNLQLNNLNDIKFQLLQKKNSIIYTPQQPIQNIQQQCFPNIFQQTSLLNNQNLQTQLNQVNNDSPQEQIKLMQQELAHQKQQIQQMQQLNMDQLGYMKSMQQNQQQNILDQIIKKNNQLLSQQMSMQDQVYQQTFNPSYHFQSSQLQRQHSTQLNQQQQLQQQQQQQHNLNNFILNRNLSAPEFRNQNNLSEYIPHKNKIHQSIQNIDIPTHMNINQFNSISATGGDQISNSSSTTTSKNGGNIFMLNQLSAMHKQSSLQEQTIASKFESIKQEQIDNLYQYQVDTSKNIQYNKDSFGQDQSFLQNNNNTKMNNSNNQQFQSKQEYDSTNFIQNQLAFNFKQQANNSFPLIQNLQSQLQSFNNTYSKKEEI